VERAPKVSVIIPCYNLGQYLDEAVGSVLAQSYQEFEILIVDDGSTDDATRRLLTDYRRPRTRITRSENRGLPAAKNLGLSKTTAPYVCMLDADDRLDELFLEKSVGALEEDPSVAFVSHWLRTFGDESREWTPTECDISTVLDVNTINGAALVRRSALDAIGGFDETMREGYEDWDVWISLLERGFRGRILNEVLFYYRRRQGSMINAIFENKSHPRVYRYLAEKHSHSVTDHLGTLLSRRDEDLVYLQQHIQDFEAEWYRSLAPEIAKQSDDLASVERKIKTRESTSAKEKAFEEAEADRARLRVALEGSHSELARVRARLAELDDAVTRAHGEIDAIRRSASWQITAPLRRLYDLIRFGRV
jgi:glycosyltransferase involved in cell wall biosynthesis